VKNLLPAARRITIAKGAWRHAAVFEQSDVALEPKLSASHAPCSRFFAWSEVIKAASSSRRTCRAIVRVLLLPDRGDQPAHLGDIFGRNRQPAEISGDAPDRAVAPAYHYGDVIVSNTLGALERRKD
jgi:hypothetical protein